MSREEFSLHANVQTHGSDVVFRVTLDRFDEFGNDSGVVTWRDHSTLPRVEGSADQAYLALLALAKMLERKGVAARLEVPDFETLF